MLHSNRTISLASKSLILFTFGCTLAVVLMSVQYEHKLLLLNSPRLMLTLPSLSLISVCGLGAGKYFFDKFPRQILFSLFSI